jgi:hypothetical protein
MESFLLLHHLQTWVSDIRACPHSILGLESSLKGFCYRLIESLIYGVCRNTGFLYLKYLFALYLIQKIETCSDQTEADHKEKSQECHPLHVRIHVIYKKAKTLKLIFEIGKCVHHIMNLKRLMKYRHARLEFVEEAPDHLLWSQLLVAYLW